jgi:hypothetical protein
LALFELYEKKKKDVDGKQENIYIKNQQIMNKINKKTIHYQLELKADIKNSKTFIKELRKKIIRISIKLKIPIRYKKLEHIEFFNVLFYIKNYKCKSKYLCTHQSK